MKQVLSGCKTALRSIQSLFSQVRHATGRLLLRPRIMTTSQSDYQHIGGEVQSLRQDGEHVQEGEYP